MFLTELPAAVQDVASTLIPISQNATTVLAKRYLCKDDRGQLIEDPDGMFYRVAAHLARESGKFGLNEEEVFRQQLTYFRLMRGTFFEPNSPTLANAGTRTGQLSACFVIPVTDAFSNMRNGSDDGIYDALRKAQLIQQTGGGVGYDFSDLREMLALVETTKGLASGPLSFMDVFNSACEAMKQGGMRRGAQMGILRMNHPDIMTDPSRDTKEFKHQGFIQYKEDLTKLTNFNVSVSVSDAELDKITGTDPDPDYELVSPRTGPTGQKLNAKKVFAEIIQRAWSTGEPGMVFIDRMNKHNPTPRLGRYSATNPCGEQPLVPYESCNLGSMKLDMYVDADAHFMKSEFEADVIDVITMMDDVVDANQYVPGVPEIQQVTLQTRKLGLGIMGHARMLFKMGLGYHTEAGRSVSAYVYALMDIASKEQSVKLAAERGAYPYFKANWNESVAFFTADWTERAAQAREDGFDDLADRLLALIPLMAQYGMRNSTTTTVAPTGTISIIAETSGGCEPEFALEIIRNQAGSIMKELNPVFHEALVITGFDEAEIEKILAVVGQYRGSLREALTYQEDPRVVFGQEKGEALQVMADIFVVAGDIAPGDHIRMQAALQRYCDSAISKTINFPKEATVEQVEEAYLLAIQLGCKGVTVYRDGSRSFQPLTAGNRESGEVVAAKDQEIARLKAELAKIPVATAPRTRAGRLFGFADRIDTGDGRIYASVGYDGEGIREVLIEVGKSGGVLNSLVEAIGRLISLALKYRVPRDEIGSMLRGIRSANTYGFGHNQVLSIPDAVGKMIQEAPASMAASTFGNEPLNRAKLDTPGGRPLYQVPHGDDLARVRVHNVHDLGESPECPQCGSAMKFGEGCRGGTCTNSGCGYAKC